MARVSRWPVCGSILASGLQRVIAPGNAANSTLIQRVTSTKAGFKMPPVGESLSSTEIATIRDLDRCRREGSG